MKSSAFSAGLCSLLVLFGSSLQAEETSVVDEEWKSIVKEMEPIAEELAPHLFDQDDPLLRQELYQMIFSGMAVGYFSRFVSDANHPEFWPVLNQALNFGTPNPDNVYYLAPVAGDGIYKITGFRGTTRIVKFQVGGGDYYTKGRYPLPINYGNYDIDELTLGENGEFEVILSAERPEGYSGDYWKLDPKATHLLVRQIAYDPRTEVDGRFAIERLNSPAIRPRKTAEEIEESLRMVANWGEGWSQVSLDWLHRLREMGLVNKVKTREIAAEGGIATQRYSEGIFQLEADEALIYETDIPEDCRYWGIHLNDAMWRSVDYTNRQGDLNGHSARIDKDGKFRAVISAVDPGVPNWLDTAGYREGAIMNRWLECGAPSPTVKKVKVADVRNYLPQDTPVVTAEERDKNIRLRRQAQQLRRRW